MYRITPFAAQFRAELQADFHIRGTRCPVCIINFVNLDAEDTCTTDCCVYDHDGSAAERDARQLWIRDVLREAFRIGGLALYYKWRGRFDPADVDVDGAIRWILSHLDSYEGEVDVSTLLKQSTETE
jgi:hypothetical protein